MSLPVELRSLFVSTLLVLSLAATVSAQSWNVTGNPGTNANSNFVGTTDNVDLVFRTNNVEGMRMTGEGNVAIKNRLMLQGNRTILQGFDGAGFHWFGATPDSDLAFGIRRIGPNDYDFQLNGGLKNPLVLRANRTILQGFDGAGFHWFGPAPESDLAFGIKRIGPNNYEFRFNGDLYIRGERIIAGPAAPTVHTFASCGPGTQCGCTNAVSQVRAGAGNSCTVTSDTGSCTEQPPVGVVGMCCVCKP